MMSSMTKWALVGLLALRANGSFHNDFPHPQPPFNHTTIYDHTCTGNVTVFDTTTIVSSITVPETHYRDVVVNRTRTDTVSTCITKVTTTTLHYTISITETDSTTVTDTDSTTITETDSATITKTRTTTDTVPATITTYTTTTIISTKVDRCPTTCSISVETVNLYFWPTNRPYSYPSTYYHEELDYTFTSPSVYMLIPTARGTNNVTGPAGPSTTSWILDLNLEDVSTIVDGSITRQLTISDLGTDCPKTAEPSAIATMVDSRCDPVLAAPKQVSSWASPCNACGRFGLFDPPYAVPTLTGGLIDTTTAEPAETTEVLPPTSTPSEGVIVVITYVEGEVVGTAIIPTTGITGSMTTTVEDSASFVGPEESDSQLASTKSVDLESVTESTQALETTTASVLPTTTSALITPSAPPFILPSTSTTVATVVTASAARVTGGVAWLMLSLGVSFLLC